MQTITDKKPTILSLNTILKDFDELLSKKTESEDCKTLDRWANYTQSSKRSLRTRRMSQTDDIKSNEQRTQLYSQEDINEIKARIRFEQKDKEIQNNAKLCSSQKTLQIVDIQQIKAEVRVQLSMKKKKSPQRVQKQKENIKLKQKSRCEQCIQLLIMGLPTKHCVNH